MSKKINGGIYPTMITPYKRSGEIDFDNVRKLVDWYIEKGCSGIFAVCQSSEMVYLSLKERVALAEAVVDQANGRINVVASGHCGNSIE
ncbi:MAG: dihydrodipicolinate synthase family protein, partial [Clostridia bacterium]|nr:dihydrodipicolinate synthase family protein [Clostridia bacterium]